MESYVISVSAGTGCYRHIQISKSATLYQLHKAILSAFGFEDDHAHAFFMDNKMWSLDGAYYSMKMDGHELLTKNYRLKKLNLAQGDKFKYVFDFGEEWRFQCRVLRETDETQSLPCVIRSVGESPEQYPEPERYGEDWDADGENEGECLPELLPQDVIESLFKTLPVSMKTVRNIHQYFEAAARLYGVIPVAKLLELYNSQNEAIDKDIFWVLAEIIRHERNLFCIIGPEDYTDNVLPNPSNWDVVDDHLLLDDPEDYPKLVKAQGNKPYKILPREEFLKYADRDYFPDTPQNKALRNYLHSRGDLPWPDDTWLGIQSMVEADFDFATVLSCCEQEGMLIRSRADMGEFAAVFQELNNHTRKQINRGHTPAELFVQSSHGIQLPRRYAPENQTSLFDVQLPKSGLASMKSPSRNGPCPCGSGKKYKRCCGKLS